MDETKEKHENFWTEVKRNPLRGGLHLTQNKTKKCHSFGKLLSTTSKIKTK